jgi:hypothetical protein
MTPTVALTLTHAGAPLEAAVTPVAEPRTPSPRRRTGPDTLLFTFVCGVVATIGAVTSIVDGGIPAMLASIVLLMLLTGLILRVTFSFLDDAGDDDGEASMTRR